MNPNNPSKFQEFRKHRVLVVENHKRLSEHIVRFINEQQDFHSVGTADNGVQALEMVTLHAPDLILMELSLPQLNGFELLMHLKQHNPETRCVIFSAHWDSSYVTKARELGADAYVFKSNPEELLPALKQVAAGVNAFPETAMAC